MLTSTTNMRKTDSIQEAFNEANEDGKAERRK